MAPKSLRFQKRSRAHDPALQVRSMPTRSGKYPFAPPAQPDSPNVPEALRTARTDAWAPSRMTDFLTYAALDLRLELGQGGKWAHGPWIGGDFRVDPIELGAFFARIGVERSR